jgi:aldehyde:ferredoxin oxidoreductase
MESNYIRGAGFGIKYLYDEVPASTDALGPENKLIFASGPFSGTTVPCASRMAVTGKSPLTGGHFPVELKFAGHDALIIEGKAKKPIYLWIKKGTVKFRNAKRVWGMKTLDTQQIIKNELKDQNVRIACIGSAGEKQSTCAKGHKEFV